MRLKVVDSDFVSARTAAAPQRVPAISQRPQQRLVGFSNWATMARREVVAHSAHDRPVLIEGETGTGKKFLARLIHDLSPRQDGPFVPVSVAQLSEEAADAALFGSIRITSSGAHYTSRGFAQKASGGTLYIDGALTLSPVVRSKLWRLIERGEFFMSGDSIAEQVDLRVVLGHPTQGGSHAIPVSDRLSVPPLRHRKVDIEPLSKHFLRQHCRVNQKEPRRISPDAIDALRRYDWPGNVGELRSVIEFCVGQSEPPPITTSLLPAHLADRPVLFGSPDEESEVDLSHELKRIEKGFLIQALRKTGGVQSKAAKLLGLKPTTLSRKLKCYEIDAENI